MAEVSACMRRSLASPNLRVWQHPGKALRFLVGRRGRSDVLLLGGAWEPGDGGHPARDPRALIATAQRTVKAAVGVDLSLCTQWRAAPWCLDIVSGRVAPHTVFLFSAPNSQHAPRSLLALHPRAWSLASGRVLLDVYLAVKCTCILLVQNASPPRWGW